MRMIFFMSTILCSSALFADVILVPTIENVHVAQNHQKTGSVKFVIDDNDFERASPESPMYIMLDFSHSSVLSQTRVDIVGGSENSTSINLAIQVEDAQVNMPENTVSIVRWRMNEPRIWLSVNSSSSTWVNNSGNLEPPSPNHRVFFSIGITGEASINENSESFDQGTANLNGNVRDDQPIDTSIRLDLRNSTLQVGGETLSVDSPLIIYEAVGVTTVQNYRDIEILDFAGQFPTSYAVGFAVQGVPALGSLGFVMLFFCIVGAGLFLNRKNVIV